MQHHMFTVYDSKAEAYLPPFYSLNRATALRQFKDTVNTRDHSFNIHPADFTLFEVGIYSDTQCTFELKNTPEPIAKAIEVLNKPEYQPPLFGGDAVPCPEVRERELDEEDRKNFKLSDLDH